MLAACGPDAPASRQAADGSGGAAGSWDKDPGPFIQHSTNLETRLESVRGLITPNELFFVRNHTATPRIDPATYRLRIEGDAIDRTVELTYDELLALPSRSTIAYIECAGNGRGFFTRVFDRPAEGGQWLTGGVGCAAWTGPTLASVLELAGVRPNAVDVSLIGLDQVTFERPMSSDKALDPNTLLVHTMNGEALPADHGFPIRAFVPGWVGSNSVKWLGRIVVSSSKVWVKTNTTSYVLVGPEWPAEQYAPAQGAPVTTQNVKSALALPWPARVEPGRQTIRGFAYSPHGPIESVEWSDDAGENWHPATLTSPALPLAWRLFDFAWDARPGAHALMVRATDARGDRQPERVAFNQKGYLFNAPVPHPIEVT